MDLKECHCYLCLLVSSLRTLIFQEFSMCQTLWDFPIFHCWTQLWQGFPFWKKDGSSAIVTYTYLKQFCKIKETLKLSFGVISFSMFRSQKYMFKNYILLWNVSWQFHLTNMIKTVLPKHFGPLFEFLKHRSILALWTSYQKKLTTNTCNFMIWLHVQVYICIYEQVL